MKPSERLAQRQSTPSSLWPAWLAKLFAAMHDVPWIAITTISVVVGSALQFAYFKSIGHVPSDLAALTTLAISTSATAMASLVALAVFMFLPSLVAHAYSVEQSGSAHTPIGPNELWSAQATAMGLILLNSGYQKYSECGAQLGWNFYAGLASAGIGLAHTGYVYMRRDLQGSRLSRSLATILIGVSFVAPLLALLPLAKIVSSDWLDSGMLALSFWVLVLAFNALVVEARAPMFKLVVLAAGFAVFLYIALPLGTASAPRIAENVAETLGVKSEGAVTVLLSKRACTLFDAVAPPAAGTSPPACASEDANVRQAMIWSNVGSRWVLGPPPSADGDKLYRRVTVPGDGVQVLTVKQASMPGRLQCR